MKPIELRHAVLGLLVTGIMSAVADVTLAAEPYALSSNGPDRIVTKAACTPAGSNFLNIGRVVRVKVNGAWLKYCESRRFIDQGETVLDRTTGLVWEKKTDDGSVHDKDLVFNWTANQDRSTGPWNFNGTAKTQFIDQLNKAGGCFADQCDWRLPTIDELKGIIDTGRAGCPAVEGCMDPALGPTPSQPMESYNWTSTVVEQKPWFAVDSGGYGGVGYNWKDLPRSARAVRGGDK